MPNSSELLTRFRADMVDELQPYLWTDDDFYTYLNDAQTLFCRLIGGLGDASSAVTQLAVVTTTDWIDLSPLILKIRGAHFVSTGRVVDIINFDDMQKQCIRFDGRVGPARTLIIGMEPNKVRCYPYPALDDTIQLIVDRLPLEAIVGEEQDLEIDEQHHLNMLLWTKYCAFSKQDAETLNVRRAQEFRQEFYAYCAAAKTEKDRAKHKTRITVYGGL